MKLVMDIASFIFFGASVTWMTGQETFTAWWPLNS